MELISGQPSLCRGMSRHIPYNERVRRRQAAPYILCLGEDEGVNILGRVAVFPTMPPRIRRLYDLAYNLWWSWHAEAQALYADLDPALWEQVDHNPIRQLAEVDPKRLDAMAADTNYLARYDAVLADFDHYMAPDTPTWFRSTYGDLQTATND